LAFKCHYTTNKRNGSNVGVQPIGSVALHDLPLEDTNQPTLIDEHNHDAETRFVFENWSILKHIKYIIKNDIIVVVTHFSTKIKLYINETRLKNMTMIDNFKVESSLKNIIPFFIWRFSKIFFNVQLRND
jgi:hypothetical protein